MGEHHQQMISLPLVAAGADGQPLSLLQALRQVLPEHVPEDADDVRRPSSFQVLAILVMSCLSSPVPCRFVCAVRNDS